VYAQDETYRGKDSADAMENQLRRFDFLRQHDKHGVSGFSIGYLYSAMSSHFSFSPHCHHGVSMGTSSPPIVHIGLGIIISLQVFLSINNSLTSLVRLNPKIMVAFNMCIALFIVLVRDSLVVHSIIVIRCRQQ